MPTISEWENHFKTLSLERRRELNKALACLEADSLIKKHFDWTLLFVLESVIMTTDPLLRIEYNNSNEEKRKEGVKANESNESNESKR